MKRFLLISLTTIFITQIANAQFIYQDRVRTYTTDSIHTIPRQPWKAAGEVVGINLGVWAFNRYIVGEDFAMINGSTIKDNLSSLPRWDTDKFDTNLLAHPYHGSLYFNAARSNGMGFWESMPYTVGGSLVWEYFMENEPPSLNDLIATTFGGVELGEITFRLSDLFIDNRTTGIERIGREVLSGIISPIRGINRVVSGEAWKQSMSKGRSFKDVPVNFVTHVGVRGLAQQEDLENKSVGMHFGMSIEYGEPYNDDYYMPYEWFRLHVGADLFSSQPLVSQVNAIGALWGKTVWTDSKNNRTLTAGVFQHFDYYDSFLNMKDGSPGDAPYRISQAAAVGGGLLYNKKTMGTEEVEVFAEGYLNAILLGASSSDYFRIDERDYNMGSGYSIKAFAGLTYKKRWGFTMQIENYHIFTWRGYDENIDWNMVDHESLNVQGDEGNARLAVFSSNLYYMHSKNLTFNLSNRSFARRTHYKLYEDVDRVVSDIMLGISFKL
jgi:hypothetical protein